MGLLSAMAEIIRDLLIFVGVMFAMFIALIVIVSRLPNDNPLKRLLTTLTYRVGATLAAGVVAIPIEPIPGVDVLYDSAGRSAPHQPQRPMMEETFSRGATPRRRELFSAHVPPREVSHQFDIQLN